MWQSARFLIFVAVICLNLNVLRAAEDEVGYANDYVDEILQNLRNEPSLVTKMDPVKIPEISEKDFELYDGVINGLSSIYRHGDFILAYDGETVKITGEVAVKDVSAKVSYRARALFFWVKGKAAAKLDHLALNMKLSSSEGKVRLDSFKVVHLGEYEITEISGMSKVMNWMLKNIANSIAVNSKEKIIHALEVDAANALRKELEKIEFPFST